MSAHRDPMTKILILAVCVALVAVAVPNAGSLPLPPLPNVSQCTDAPLPRVCINLRHQTVHNGEAQNFNNSTIVDNGGWTVEAGGKLEIDNSSLNFTVDSSGIDVQAGGVVRIVLSTVASTNVTGDHTVTLAPTAHVFILESDFTRIQVHDESNDSVIDSNDFASAPGTALDLFDVNFTLDGNMFQDNGVGIHADHSNVTIQDGSFWHNVDTDPTHPAGLGVGIELVDSCPVSIISNTFRDLTIDISELRSCGYIQDNDMSDKADPGDIGALLRNSGGPTTVSGNSFVTLGVGIRCIGSPDTTLAGNSFASNVQDNDGC